MADRLLAVKPMVIRDKPVGIQRWAPSMSELGVEMDFVYLWAELPGLTPQFYELLKEIGNPIGEFVSSKYSVKDMYGSARPTICVQIASGDPLIPLVNLSVGAAGQVMWRLQQVQYLDLNLQCTFCGLIGHTHKTCPGPGKRGAAPGAGGFVSAASVPAEGLGREEGRASASGSGGSWAAVVRGRGSSDSRTGSPDAAGAGLSAGTQEPSVGPVTARNAAAIIETAAQKDLRMAKSLFQTMWPEQRWNGRVHFRLALALQIRVDGRSLLWTPAESLTIKFPTWNVEFDQLGEASAASLEAYCYAKLERMLRYDFPELRSRSADRKAILRSLTVKWVLHSVSGGGMQGLYIGYGTLPPGASGTKIRSTSGLL